MLLDIFEDMYVGMYEWSSGCLATANAFEELLLKNFVSQKMF